VATLPYASVADLAAWVGQDIVDNDKRALALLKAASIRVRTYVGESVAEGWDDLETETPSVPPVPIPDIVQSVVVQVAARVWINPQGLTTEANDDYTRRFGDDARGGIYLSDEEKADLNDVKPSGRGGLSVISTTRGEDELDEYLAVVNSESGTTTSELFPFLPPGGWR
jgi:hypothetical protein